MDQTFDNQELGLLAEQKVISVALLNDYILFGTEKGLLSCSSIKTGRNLEPMNLAQIASNKKQIDKILVNCELSIAYVLCNGEVKVFSIPSLKEHNALKSKDEIVKIVLNSSRKSDSKDLLIITKKKKVRIYSYDQKDQTLKEIVKDITLPEMPDIAEWYENILCFKAKKSIYWYNLDTAKLLTSEMEAENINYIKDSIIVLQKELAILMDMNTVKQFTPIVLDEKDVIQFLEYKNYVLSFHEGAICFYLFGDNDSTKFQTIPITPGEVGKFVLLSGKNTGNLQTDANLKLVYVTQNTTNLKWKAYEIKEKPYEQIMNKLLAEGKIDDALAKLNDNIFSNKEDKMDIIERFFLDAAWVSLKNRNFSVAHSYARLTNFNPFEFIYTYYTQLNLELLHIDKSAKITKDLAKNQIEIFTKPQGAVTVTAGENYEKQALKFLMDLLMDKRAYFLNKFEFPKDNGKKLKFITSKMALIDLSESGVELTLAETMNYINSTLVKVMIKYKHNPKEIAAIIDHPTFNCNNSICDFTKDDFFSMFTTDECKIAMAYFYEKIGKYKQALEIWKNFGTNEKGNKAANAIFAKEAKDRTKKIFYKFKQDHLNREQNNRLFQEYLPWLLVKNPDDAFDIVINTEFVKIDHFLSNIITNVESGLTTKNLKEQFLIYYNKKHPEEKYQTQLIELFIEKLFRMMNKDTPINAIHFEGELKANFDMLMTYLKAEKACFSKNYILDKLKDTWLLDGEIYLYSELKMHTNALEKLIENAIGEGSERFAKVELYCEENFAQKPEIYNMLLKMLIDKYNSLKEANAAEQRRKVYEDEIINLMQKNKEVEKIDPVAALEMLPENLNVCDERLYDYLTNVIQEYTSLTNKYKIARSVSDMALAYKEKELIDEKKKYVIIENETICDFCKKKIGTTIFVVYPNMKIYHSKCAPNPSVCPTTGIDFSKKIMIQDS